MLDDLRILHGKWESKCKDKIETYLHSVFKLSLYGSLEINFEGFKLEGIEDE